MVSSGGNGCMKIGISDKLGSKIDRSGGPDACWPWTGYVNKCGYGVTCRTGNKTVLVHRATFEKAHGPIPEGLCVCHRCDNPPCQNLAHLFLGTHKENMEDRERKGRGNRAKGEKAGNSKLTEREVIQIRSLYETGKWNYCSLGRKFNTGRVNIRFIVKRRTWKHI